MHTIAGTYQGEGPNTTAAIANVPDVNAAPSGSTENAANTADTAKKALGRTVGLAMDRRFRARVSSESARDAVAFTNADQQLANVTRGVYITTGGALQCIFADNASATSVTLTGLIAGQVYPFSIAKVVGAGTTAAGFLLF